MSLLAGAGYVVVELLPNTNITDGGIHLPDGAVCLSNRGVVISDCDTWEGVEDGHEGKVVHFPLHHAHKLVYNGTEYLAVSHEHILAVEEND